eukprot:CAMPEP_0184476604 /NCGR_PEP_ID=MMETSP0740-20130409/147170_1 /TAXON_ID=385413 /ORGANISM="Thalassiosira miniscula, Strain CCMP1093" /LENGTH=68 /DNA_ID=CAMNT_0026854169 /DNA_START=566 /DNA_END=772 /DNA_ORIENTATION=+
MSPNPAAEAIIGSSDPEPPKEEDEAKLVSEEEKEERSSLEVKSLDSWVLDSSEPPRDQNGMFWRSIYG